MAKLQDKDFKQVSGGTEESTEDLINKQLDLLKQLTVKVSLLATDPKTPEEFKNKMMQYLEVLKKQTEIANMNMRKVNSNIAKIENISKQL